MSLTDSLLQSGKEHVQEGRVLNVWYAPGFVYGVVAGNSNFHTPEVRLDGRRYCGCKGCWFNGDDLCSHMVALVESVEPEATRIKLYEALQQSEPIMNVDDYYVRTMVSTFNEMMSMGGIEAGLPRKSGMVLAGRPEAGKTILTYQFAFDTLRSIGEGNAVIVDTEGSGPIYAMWEQIFIDRFGIDVEVVPVEIFVDDQGNISHDMTRKPDAEHQIFIIDVRELEDILRIHGRPANINTEDNKMKLDPAGEFVDVWDSWMGQFVSNNDIVYHAYDSVSNPLEIFTNRQQDRPTRSKATQWWLLQAQAMAQNMDTVQVYVTHLSKNPASPYDRPGIIGGKAVKHQNKHAIYLNTSDSDAGHRQMRLLRHPSKTPWVDKYQLNLESGAGFVDPN